MKAYKVKEEYMYLWGSDHYSGIIVTHDNVEWLSREWGKSVDELLEQLEEIDPESMGDDGYEASDLCEALERMGDHADADEDTKTAVIKDIRHYLAEIEELKSERREHWQNGNKEEYNRYSNDIADLNLSIRILKESYHITDAEICPTADGAETVCKALERMDDEQREEFYTRLVENGLSSDDVENIKRLLSLRKLFADPTFYSAVQDAVFEEIRQDGHNEKEM